MSIANPEQVFALFHKILNDDESILIDFIFLIRTESASIAKRDLRDEIVIIFFISIISG
jgi:hypothetical protein